MSFRTDKAGSVLVNFALALPILLSLCALAFDGAILRFNKSQLQLAADAGALAGVDKIANQTTAKTIAAQISQSNAPQGVANVTSVSDVDLGTYDTTTKSFQISTQNPNAVRVHAFRTAGRNNLVQTKFTQFLGKSQLFAISASAIAITGNPFCNYILDPSAAGALALNLGISFNSTCGLQVNSSSNAAISTLGFYSVNVSSTCIVGNYSAFGFGSFNPAPKTGCVSRPDPLSALPEPSAVQSCQTVLLPVVNGTLNPGCYTGLVTISGQVTLNPGLFQFQNAQLVVLGAGIIKGDGVTLYFDKQSSFTMAALAGVSIAAPNAGTYQGIALFFSRSAVNSAVNIIGGSLISINGTIYAPATTLTLTGVAAVTGNYGYLVVDRLIATGLGSINLNAFVSDPRRPMAMSSRAVLVQ